MEYRYLGKERLKVSAGWFEKLLKPRRTNYEFDPSDSWVISRSRDERLLQKMGGQPRLRFLCTASDFARGL